MTRMNICVLVFSMLHLSIHHVFSLSAGEELLPKECGTPLSYNPFFGPPTTPANAYPWIAALFYESKGSKNRKPYVGCSGTLINSRYILTAAHCSVKKSYAELSHIRIGEWDLNTDEDCITTAYGQQCLPRPIVAGPEEIIIHPSYNAENHSNDIALLRLNISIDFNSIYGLNPICLPPSDFIYKYAAVDKRSFAAGWGAIISSSQGDEQRPILRSVALPLADEKICREHYENTYDESRQLCVGAKGHDTCYGDGGGPLILPGPSDSSYIQVGIVSYGKSCEVVPSVYTSVVAYRDWIVQNQKP